jgi:hypothetical protein
MKTSDPVSPIATTADAPAMRCRMASASMEGNNAVEIIGDRGCKAAMSMANRPSRALAD